MKATLTGSTGSTTRLSKIPQPRMEAGAAVAGRPGEPGMLAGLRLGSRV